MASLRKRQKLPYWINLAGDVLEEHGCRLTGVARTNGDHLKVTVENPTTGETRFVTASLTASDSRSDKNLRSTLRRICRELTS